MTSKPSGSRAGPMDKPRPGPAATADPDNGNSITVLTLNTHKGLSALNRRFVLPELRSAIRSIGADIVFLQEVIGAHQHHASRFPGWPDNPQYEFLADSIWPQYAYGRNAIYPHGDHGNALLSKFPIEHYDNVDVSLGRHERRGILHCQLRRPGAELPIHAICVHLGLRERHRRHQLDQLCQLLAQLPDNQPVVIAGDFNDWQQRACERLARCAGMHEVWSQAAGMPARTFPAFYPLLRLDRIYVRNVESHHPRTLSTRPWPHLSDHLPLAATLNLVTQRPAAGNDSRGQRLDRMDIR